jgi:hypothetical protein
MSSAAELDVAPVQAKVVSTPFRRDQRRANRCLAIRRLLLSGLILGIGLAAVWYGSRW